MAAPHGVNHSALVGRSEELRTVGALLDKAVAGEAGALLISGDAGAGKSALVQAACSSSADSALVLAGACLPLSSMTVPFLPIRSALRDARRQGVVFPEIFERGDPASNVPIMFDSWLDDFCPGRPVILVVDDVHWADQSTLDLLMYLLAGPADRRLVVIATIRSTEVGDSHPLQRWLANVRRLPRVDQMALGPLDRLGTAEQIAELMGAPSHQSLVDEVFTLTRGNPYLNRLVVDGVAPNARRLPPNLPSDLTSFVLESWRRLSAPAQELAGILAMGGRPASAQDLSNVGGGTRSVAEVDSLLREAANSGNLEAVGDGQYWFRHPMEAEAYVQSLSNEERRGWHAAFAELEERRLTLESTVETLVAVADHHDLAGHVAEAYRWALRAADAAGEAGGTTEKLRLLRRAVDLRQQLPDSGEDVRGLLRQLISAAAAAAAYEEEILAVDQLLVDVDPATDPLLAAELLVRRTQLRLSTGRAFLSPDDLDEAVRLSATEPDSWQHALALAHLCRAHVWQDDPRAKQEADQALDAARAADDPRALSWALAASAMVAAMQNDLQSGRELATEAIETAARSMDFRAFVNATLWETNASDDRWSGHLIAEHMQRRREQLTRLGAPHTFVAELSAYEASNSLKSGDWKACLDRLRVALGSDPGPFADVVARLTAARLAAWQGRTAEAEAHLARVDELFAGGSGYLGLGIGAIRAEVLIAAGDHAAAFDAAMAASSTDGVTPDMCAWLVPLAARALADQIQPERDAGRDPSDLLARVDDLLAHFPAVIRDTGESGEPFERHVAAFDRLYEAEVGRARADQANGTQWVDAADAFNAAALPLEESYACWRAAESLLVRGRQTRGLATTMIRRGLELADALGAQPIKIAVESLASSARIRVDRVGARSSSLDHDSALKGLTPRESEILDHIVAGRTYGEIARSLVISEKTVSSHVSNLLRKTGTSNRVDLSRLASAAASDPTST